MQAVGLAAEHVDHRQFLRLQFLSANVGRSSHKVQIVEQLVLSELIKAIDGRFADLWAEREAHQTERVITEAGRLVSAQR